MLRLRWDEFGKPMGLDGTATPEFSFYDDDRRLASARVAIPFDLASRLGGPSQAALENALFRFAVPRFEALAIAGEVPEDYTIEPVFIRTTPDDASEIAGYVEEVKECVYQITADGGDLYCGAAVSTVIGSSPLAVMRSPRPWPWVLPRGGHEEFPGHGQVI
ncbi:MAG: hypothetical protein ACRDG5_01145, partial [Anaerolineales bacterium]